MVVNVANHQVADKPVERERPERLEEDGLHRSSQPSRRLKQLRGLEKGGIEVENHHRCGATQAGGQTNVRDSLERADGAVQ